MAIERQPKVFMVKEVEGQREPMPLSDLNDSILLIMQSYDDVLNLLDELGYEQRPDSSATSVRELFEELLADVLDAVGHDYRGSAKYEIKRLLKRRLGNADIQESEHSD